MPALVAFTDMTATPVASVVPLPSAQPDKLIPTPSTGVPSLVTVKVTSVGSLTNTVVGLAEIDSAGIGVPPIFNTKKALLGIR